MSVLSHKINDKELLDYERENQERDEERNNENKFIGYYRQYLPNVVPNALFKYTKFLTLDKYNGGLLTDEEKRDFNEIPTGYNFNIKNTNYLVIDVDIDPLFTALNDHSDDFKKQLKYLNAYKGKDLDDDLIIPNDIVYKEYNLDNKKKIIRTKEKSLIIFALLFKTPFIRTASKGFHFYFRNDLDNETINDIFGYLKSSYIKCIRLFNNTVDIDIFLDNNIDDSNLVLPFSSVLIENEKYKNDPENNHKNLLVQYSGIRYIKINDKIYDEFRPASDLLKWLKKRVIKKSFKNVENIEKSNFIDKGRVLSVPDMYEKIYINYMINNFRLYRSCAKEIKTYASQPCNLYQLMSFIAFFPVNMHRDLLDSFIEELNHLFSDNCKKQLLSYYYHLAIDDDKIKDLKHPGYFESILYNSLRDEEVIKNKYKFIYKKN